MITPLLRAAMWAGVIALDFTGFGPWMISQPLVCGPIFGWLMGNVSVGLILGGIVQLLWMDVTPVGVGIPYDATAVTLLAIYWSGSTPQNSLSQIVLALFVAAPFGFLFRTMDQYARRLNTLLARRIESVSDERLSIALGFGILGGLAWSWIRYALFYLGSFWLGGKLWSFLATWPKLTWAEQGLRMAVILLPVAGLGVTLELFLSDQPEQRWASWGPFKNLRSDSDSK